MTSFFFTKKWQIILYFFVIGSCYFLFDQGDMNHTALSSYAYLKGHFSDFYSYNKVVVGGNDYLPSIYLVYAFFNAPLTLLDFFSLGQQIGSPLNPLVQIAWWKLTGAVFFFASVFILSKISNLLEYEDFVDRKYPALVFATAPIAIFCVFIFSGYDIVGLLFSLIGFYFYLQRKFLRFALFFSIAISFKYFALVIFVPLLLLAEKRLLLILIYLVVALSFTLMQFLVYWHDPVFSGEIFSLLLGKIHGNVNTLEYLKALCLFLYTIGCVCLYFQKIDSKSDFERMAIFTSIISYGLMFCSVIWHPQWLILMTPFIALSFLYINNKKVFVICELFGMLAYIWLIVNIWPYNVDLGMVNRGPLIDHIPKVLLIGSDLYSIKALPFLRVVFHVYLFFPVLIFLYERLKKAKAREIINIDNIIFSRFSIGLAFFLLPVIFSLFVPLSIAKKLNQLAFLNTQKEIVIQPKAETIVGEIYKNYSIQQTFKSEFNGLTGVSFMLANFGRPVSGILYMKLYDSDDNLLKTSFVDVKKVSDNQFYGFEFPELVDSKNKYYRLELAIPDGESGSTLTAWCSKQDEYADGELIIKTAEVAEDLVLNVYYNPKHFKKDK